jgi:hypothetical protein
MWRIPGSSLGVVGVEQGGVEREEGGTHCRHCAHSPARPLAGSMSTAAAVAAAATSTTAAGSWEGW